MGRAPDPTCCGRSSGDLGWKGLRPPLPSSRSWIIKPFSLEARWSWGLQTVLWRWQSSMSTSCAAAKIGHPYRPELDASDRRLSLVPTETPRLPGRMRCRLSLVLVWR